MCRIAVECNCIVFNIDYRKAPEAKLPKGQQDFYDFIRHVYHFSEKFGVNKYQMCSSGTSGGGLICLGASYLMMK